MHILTILMYVFVLVIGAVSAYVGLANQGDISTASKGCSRALQNANTGLIMLSVVMLTATVVSGYCSFSCGSIEKISNKLKNAYYGFVLFVFIALTVVGVLMNSQADVKDHECPNVKKRVALLMYTGITGIIFFFMAGGLTIIAAHSKKEDTTSAMCGVKRSEA